jgi:hypothetical protein
VSQQSTRQRAIDHGQSQTGVGLYVVFTITAALVAATAAHVTLSLAIAPWAMFMGWVAYFTRRPSPAEGLRSLACVVIGLCLGAAATITVAGVTPALGGLALPVTVFGTALIVLAARGLPLINNLLGYFIGLITFFAAHLDPGLQSIAELASAVGIGALAAWLAQTVEGGIRKVVHA